MTITKPPLVYWGGKWNMAPWAIAHFPPHETYVEAFGGGASVLLRKARSATEVYNDLDSNLVTFFRVLRDREQAEELRRRMRLMPFSLEEYKRLGNVDWSTFDDVGVALALLVRSRQGYAAFGYQAKLTCGWGGSGGSPGPAARAWARAVDEIDALTERMQGVIIDQRDGAVVMRERDGPDTLHYVDPPYLGDARQNPEQQIYRHDMLRAEEHEALLRVLLDLRGMVVLCGYPSETYRRLLLPAGWLELTRRSYVGGSSATRTETMWLNPLTAARLAQRRLELEWESE